VEFIEVFTIVLAIEVSRDWRAAVTHIVATLTVLRCHLPAERAVARSADADLA
jgi:uncharacterized membrane protein